MINLKSGLDRVIENAMADKDFRISLVERPVVTIERFLDTSLASFEKPIVVNDQTDSSCIYLNIMAPPNCFDELSEYELDMLSGGTFRGLGRKVGAASMAAMNSILDCIFSQHSASYYAMQ